MNIVIPGNVPSKKNSKRVFRPNGGGMVFVPSANHQDWHRTGSYLVASWKNTLSLAERRQLPLRKAGIEITIYPPDRRKADLTNKTESVNDLLVDCGVLEDDNWFILGRVVLQFGGVDTKNPRVEIELKYPPHGTT